MREIVVSEVIERHESPLHRRRTTFNIVPQFHHEPDILRQGASGKHGECVRECELRLVFDDAGRILFLEAPTADGIADHAETHIVAHIIQTDIAQPLFSDDAPIFSAWQLIAILKEPLPERVQNRRRRVAGRTIHVVLAGEGRNGSRPIRHDETGEHDDGKNSTGYDHGLETALHNSALSSEFTALT